MLKTSADLPNDIEALKALVLSQQTELHAHSLIIQALRLQIARLKKQKFGASSEKIQREIAQLELALEGLEIASVENNATPSDEGDKVDPKDSDEDNSAPKSPRRRPRVCDTIPREQRRLDPGEVCADCGGALRLIGEDISSILEMVTAKLKVIETARPKKSCRCCEKIVQVPAPTRPIPGSLAGPSLLAFILVSKYDDHCVPRHIN